MDKFLTQFPNDDISDILKSHVIDTLKVTDIKPYYFAGVLAGSPLATYTATIVYVGHFIAGHNVNTNLPSKVGFYDELNAYIASFAAMAVAFDITLPANIYYPNIWEIKNIWFSRLSPGQNNDVGKFLGYQLTITP